MYKNRLLCHKDYLMLWKLVFWVFIAKCATIGAILFSHIGLMPDEAQYWTWSKELCYGYYSKPAGIAWQIASGTAIFGDTELGVRFGGVILSFFLSLSIYYLAKFAGSSEKAAFWAALSFALCPLGIISGFLATTDCAYVLFWTLACCSVVSDIHNKKPLSYLRLAAIIGLGALWKWPIYALWIPVVFFFPGRNTFVGFIFSLLGLLPSLVWNLFRDFSTFRHVFTSISPYTEPRANPLDFFGAQLALVSPLLFFVLAFVVIYYKKMTRAERFCLVTSIGFFTAVLALSFYKKVQGNWAIAAYPTLFAPLALSIDRSEQFLKWTKASIVVALTLLVVTFIIPFTNVPISKNPWKEGLGWEKIAPMLTQSGYDPNTDFLFSDRYQITSILSFYGPGDKRAYFFNINGLRKNQFSYWPGMNEQCLEKTGYFVEVVINRDIEPLQERVMEKLGGHFSKITPIAPVSLVEIDGKSVKTALILRCEGYNGTMPADLEKY